VNGFWTKGISGASPCPEPADPSARPGITMIGRPAVLSAPRLFEIRKTDQKKADSAAKPMRGVAPCSERSPV
jgi:hypothetical protein